MLRRLLQIAFTWMFVASCSISQVTYGGELGTDTTSMGWPSPSTNADAWARLPEVEVGDGTMLPSWARMLAEPMPRTTAALLELDLVHRRGGPVPEALRHGMRWLSARSNQSEYAMAMAEGDGRRAGWTDQQIQGLKQGTFEGWSQQDRDALEFAIAMAVDSNGYSDEKFHALVSSFGERVVASMVLHMAFANFQDRLLICLGAPTEKDGWMAPAEIRSQRDALVVSMPTPSSRPAPTATPQVASAPPAAVGQRSLNQSMTWLSYEELQNRLASQRKRSTRLPIPDWDETIKNLPPGLLDRSTKIVWYQIAMGYAHELAVPFEIYLRTAGTEISRNWDRILGNSIFWMVTDTVNCPYCMGHCEMTWEVAGLSLSDIEKRSRILAGDDWSSLPENEQQALLFARKVTATPWKVQRPDVDTLRAGFGDERALYIAVNASRYNYMTRISNGFQLTLESENVFWDYFNVKPPATQVAAIDQPRPTPVTRPEMKQLLEDMKGRTPRIPLPTPAPGEVANEDPSRGYEARVRSLYVPSGDGMSYLAFSGSANRTRGGSLGGANPAGGARNAFGQGNPSGPGNRAPSPPDPAMSLDYAFKTRLFWIASRANNCQYCLGHQESKLLAAGMSEDEIAQLDFEWEKFPPSEQAAFALARRVTLEPHLLSDADIDACREYFSDLQIIEMIASVAGNNAINRWKEGIGVPQSSGGGNFGVPRGGDPSAQRPAENHHSYLTDTSSEYAKRISRVALIDAPPAAGTNLVMTRLARPPLESSRFVLETLAACENRKPRLQLASEEETRTAFEDANLQGPVPQWQRLLGHFPTAGRRLVILVQGGESMSALSPRLRSQIRWSTARQDRAWYAMSLARQELRSIGVTDEQILGIDGLSSSSLSEADRALVILANHLAASPVILTDREVLHAVELAGPEAVAQCVHFTCICALFNRLTEAAGLTAVAP